MILKSALSIDEEAVSHNPNVRKKVYLRNGDSENITQISRTRFPPGESCGQHSHMDMWEFFLIEEGELNFRIDGQTHQLKAGDSLLIAPGEVHAVSNQTMLSAVVTVMGWT
jgi:quercetin dioxygenase-like cupin family protein